MQVPPKKSFVVQKVAFLVFLVILGLGLCEYVVRQFKLAPEIFSQVSHLRFVDNIKMVYEYLPGTVVDGCVLNKQGFKDSDFVLEKAKDVVRIAMLGDSVVEGVFAPCKRSFSDQLEVLLNRKAVEIQPRLRYEVMNFGVGGYNLGAELEVLKEKVLPYKPDIVVLNLTHDDNAPFPGGNRFFVENNYNLTEQQQIDLVRKYVENRNSFARWFEKKILLKSKLYLFLVTRMGPLPKDKAVLSRERSSEGDLSDMQCVSRGFLEIQKLEKRHGFKFLICIHPGLLFFESENNLKFASLAKSFQFDYFHMIDYYRKSGASPESLQLKDHPNDTNHPNEFGHALIADAMFVELKKHGMIDSRL